MADGRIMIRSGALLCAAIILSVLHLCAAHAAETVELESDAVMRSFKGDAGPLTRLNFSGGTTVQQSLFPRLFNNKVGFVMTGFDFHYFEMNNDNASMQCYQAGLIFSFYFSNIFNAAKDRSMRSLFPLIRLHGGYSRAEINSEALGIRLNGGNNQFLGAGAGLGIMIYKGLNIKTVYMFDTHFFTDGYIFIHSLSIACAYQFSVKK